jgi:hypothetical protein
MEEMGCSDILEKYNGLLKYLFKGSNFIIIEKII